MEGRGTDWGRPCPADRTMHVETRNRVACIASGRQYQSSVWMLIFLPRILCNRGAGAR